MIRSMTAFARVERHTDGGTLVWELKSVNHRYLEVSPRLPDGLRELEPDLRDRCRKQLQRGKVECGLRFVPDTEGGVDLQLNEPLLEKLAEMLVRIGEQLRHPAPVNPTDLMRWPGVLSSGDTDPGTLKAPALELLDEAIKALLSVREREGTELARMIEERLDAVTVQVERARVALPRIIESQRDRLRQRVLEATPDPDHDRLEQELVLLAQKMDVAEEMDRLNTHVDEVRRVIREGGSVGRRLDFLMQELNREANTLASKSIDTETTQAAVELKVLIEQMREQIQNIE